MGKIKLLCIVGGMNMGGSETFLMKLFRTNKQRDIQMDFLTFSDGVYDEEIVQNGGHIFHAPLKTKNPFKSFFAIKKIVKENGYTHVFRASQNSLSGLDLLAAKAGGAKTLIFRSTNSSSASSHLGHLLHYLYRPILRWTANVKIAPSKEAAIYMFGKSSFNKGKVSLLNNGIPLKQYSYKEEVRKTIRQQLNIDENMILIGAIGRLEEQKNPFFSLKVFKQFQKKHPNSAMIFVGVGSLKEKCEQWVKENKLDKNIFFLGKRNDVSDIYSCLDLLWLPSFYEGMPNVIIESQASALSSVVSDLVSPDCKLTDCVAFSPLEIDSWITRSEAQLLNKENRDVLSQRCVAVLQEKGYSIDDSLYMFLNLLGVSPK